MQTVAMRTTGVVASASKVISIQSFFKMATWVVLI